MVCVCVHLSVVAAAELISNKKATTTALEPASLNSNAVHQTSSSPCCPNLAKRHRNTMKRPSGVDKPKSKRHTRRARRARDDQHHVTEMLKLCLEKVCQLQADLEREEPEEMQDAEAAGYAACAMEAIKFLAEQGLSLEHPMVRTLTEKLGQNNDGRPPSRS